MTDRSLTYAARATTGFTRIRSRTGKIGYSGPERRRRRGGLTSKFAGPGIHEMSLEEYLAHPAISRGVMLDTLISPALGRASMDFPGETTPQMRLGTATHTIVYEPDEMPLRFSIWKETRKDEKTGETRKRPRQGNDWKAHLKAAEIGGRDPNLTEGQYKLATSMSKAVKEHPIAGALLRRQPSRMELVIIYKDKVTGFLIKVRIDQLIEDEFPTINDLKTCQSVGDREFAKAIIDHGYDIQSDLYPTGFLALAGRGQPQLRPDARAEANAAAEGEEIIYEPPVNFVITAVEKKLTIPSADGKTLTHAVRVFDMARCRAGGRMRARYALDILAQCEKNKKWPSYPLQVERCDPPDWYLRQWGGIRR